MPRQPSSSPVLMTLYEEFLKHQDEASYGRAVAARYEASTLQRLAQVGDRYRRRAAVLGLGLLGEYDSNHVLGCALSDKDRGVRQLAEEAIESVWLRAGNDAHRDDLRIVMQRIAQRKFREAAECATELIERAPWFAEVWNQRSITYYQLDRYSDSIRDGRQALEINPYHFGAAVGMAKSYLKLNDHVSALECFRRALRLNPNLEQARAQIAFLEKSLKDKKDR
ncbi:MAG: tetratricopeptide repeat protein [Planctomycetota bacterium]|nr:tetratricopeptide repeat protein [Planctomycetota bacterium]